MNWKTTSLGIGGAVLLIVITYLVNKSVDPQTLVIAAGMAGIGTAASDAPTVIKTVVGEASQLPVLQTPIVKNVASIADNIVGLESASHPTNVLLSDIKAGLDALNTTVATTSTPSQPVVIDNTVKAS